MSATLIRRQEEAEEELQRGYCWGSDFANMKTNKRARNEKKRMKEKWQRRIKTKLPPSNLCWELDVSCNCWNALLNAHGGAPNDPLAISLRESLCMGTLVKWPCSSSPWISLCCRVEEPSPLCFPPTTSYTAFHPPPNISFQPLSRLTSLICQAQMIALTSNIIFSTILKLLTGFITIQVFSCSIFLTVWECRRAEI